MADITAAECILSLKRAHRPSVPFTNRGPLFHIEDPGLDGIFQPPDDRRVEWLVKSKLVDTLRSPDESGLPIPRAKLTQETWPTREIGRAHV